MIPFTLTFQDGSKQTIHLPVQNSRVIHTKKATTLEVSMFLKKFLQPISAKVVLGFTLGIVLVSLVLTFCEPDAQRHRP